MLREIRVYGQLAKFLGRRTFKAAVSNAAEAIRFLLANFPQLERHMADQHYKVSVGSYDLALNELHDPAGMQTIRIIPVIGGAGSGIGKIAIGAALVALSFVSFGAGAWAGVGGFGATAAGTAAGSMATLAVGASLVLGGVAQLLTPAPSLTPVGMSPTFSAGTTASTEGTELDPQASYSFSGVQNTSRQGVPIPLVYGEMVVGSIVISAGVDTIQVSV
jgi:predicted phage tail protein